MKRNLIVLTMLVLLSAGGASRAATASFDVDSGRPMVELTVNGKGPYPFVFDTGSPSLLVMRSLAEEHCDTVTLFSGHDRASWARHRSAG